MIITPFVQVALHKRKKQDFVLRRRFLISHQFIVILYLQLFYPLRLGDE